MAKILRIIKERVPEFVEVPFWVWVAAALAHIVFLSLKLLRFGILVFPNPHKFFPDPPECLLN
jgi:hypothetical protein